MEFDINNIFIIFTFSYFLFWILDFYLLFYYLCFSDRCYSFFSLVSKIRSFLSSGFFSDNVGSTLISLLFSEGFFSVDVVLGDTPAGGLDVGEEFVCKFSYAAVGLTGFTSSLSELGSARGTAFC